MSDNNLAPLENKTQPSGTKRAIRALLPNASWQAIWELLKYVGLPAMVGTAVTAFWQRVTGVPADLVGVLVIAILWMVVSLVVYVLARRERRFRPALATATESPATTDRVLPATPEPSQFLLASPVLLILLLILGVAYMIKKREAPATVGLPYLEQVKGRTFINEQVVLDDHAYTDCVFRNVTFVYDGGPGSFEHNEIYGSFGLTTKNMTVTRTIVLLKGFDALRADFPLFGPNMTPLEGVEPLKKAPFPSPSPSKALGF